MTRSITQAAAIQEALDQEMARDSRVLVMGLGVDDPKAILGTTRGLAEKYGPLRVFDTPLSEDAMTGAAIGMALAGLRPVHVHIRVDFLMLAMNQIVNVAAKTHYMYGGRESVPLVIRAIIGRSWGQGAQHSQALHSFFMHVPGLRVAAPVTAYDAKGCLVAAIRDNNPVIFIEHRLLHGLQSDVPEDLYECPLGRARVIAPGTDVTLVGISYMAVECLRAREYLKEKGISAEVIDPVWLSPLDMETIASSVRRTRRALVVDTAWLPCGAGAEIITGLVESLGFQDDFRMRRMGFAHSSCPPTPGLEARFYPDAMSIASAAYAIVSGDVRPWVPEERADLRAVQFKGPF
jgi:acetoin:2,6-dichlorophenolindophenol oxidoreductase subunit beta